MKKKNSYQKRRPAHQKIPSKTSDIGESLSEIFSYHNTLSQQKDDLPESTSTSYGLIPDHWLQILAKLRRPCTETKRKALKDVEESLDKLFLHVSSPQVIHEILRLYERSAFYDPDVELRRMFHHMLARLISVAEQKSCGVIEKEFLIVLPVLWCSCSDTSAGVAHEAKKTFSLFTPSHDVAETLELIQRGRSELVDFLFTLLTWNEEAFNENALIYVNSGDCGSKAMEERYQQVLEAALAALNHLVEVLSSEPIKLIDWICSLSIFFSEKLCLHQFFNPSRYQSSVIRQAAQCISNFCKILNECNTSHPEWKLKLPFTSHELLQEFMNSSLNLFEMRFSSILDVVPFFFIQWLQLYPESLMERPKTLALGHKSSQISSRKIYSQLIQVVRHNGFAAFNDQDVPFYDSLPCVLRCFPSHDIFSSDGCVFLRNLLISLLATYQIKKDSTKRRLPLPNSVTLLRCYTHIMTMILMEVSEGESVVKLQQEVKAVWFWLPLELYLRQCLFSEASPAGQFSVKNRLDSLVPCTLRHLGYTEELHLGFSTSVALGFVEFFSWLVDWISDVLKGCSKELLESLSGVLNNFMLEWSNGSEEVLDETYLSRVLKLVDLVRLIHQKFPNFAVSTSSFSSLIQAFLEKWFRSLESWSLGHPKDTHDLYLTFVNSILNQLPLEFCVDFPWSSIVAIPSLHPTKGYERLDDANQSCIAFLVEGLLGRYFRPLLDELKTYQPTVPVYNVDRWDINDWEHLASLLDHLFRLGIPLDQKQDCITTDLPQCVLCLWEGMEARGNKVQHIVSQCISIFFFIRLSYHGSSSCHTHDEFLEKALQCLWHDLIDWAKSTSPECQNHPIPRACVLCFANVIYKEVRQTLPEWLFRTVSNDQDMAALFPLFSCESCSLAKLAIFNVFLKDTERFLKNALILKSKEDLITCSCSLFRIRSNDWDTMEQPLVHFSQQLRTPEPFHLPTFLTCLDLLLECAMLTLNREYGETSFVDAAKNQYLFLYHSAIHPATFQGTLKSWSQAAQRLGSILMLQESPGKRKDASWQEALAWSKGFSFFFSTLATLSTPLCSLLEPFGVECHSSIGLSGCLLEWYRTFHVAKVNPSWLKYTPENSCGLLSSSFDDVKDKDLFSEAMQFFFILILTSSYGIQILQHFSCPQASESLQWCETFLLTSQRVLCEYLYSEKQHHIITTQDHTPLLTLVSFFTRQVCQDAPWTERRKGVFFFLLFCFFNAVYHSIHLGGYHQEICCEKALQVVWQCILSQACHNEVPDALDRFMYVYQFYPTLVSLLNEASTYWLITRLTNQAAHEPSNASCLDVSPPPAITSAECSVENPSIVFFTQENAERALAEIAWSVSQLLNESLDDSAHLSESLTKLIVYLPFLTCLTAVQENLIYDDTLIENLLLLIERFLSFASMNRTLNLSLGSPSLVLFRNLFTFLQSVMDYLSLPHVLHRLIYDSPLLSSCLFVLSHSFDLHTQWITRESLEIYPLFLSSGLECFACCLTFFQTHPQYVIPEAVVATYESIVYNTEVLWENQKTHSCYPLQYVRFVTALDSVIKSLEKFLSTLLNTTPNTSTPEKMPDLPPSLSHFSLTRLLNLITRIALTWNYLPELQNRAWESLFAIPYPWWTLPLLQASLSDKSSRSSSLDAEYHAPLHQQGSSEYFWSVPYVVTQIRDHCEKPFIQHDLVEPLEKSTESKKEVYPKAWCVLHKCLFLFWGEDMAKELMSGPQYLVQALHQLTFNQDTKQEHLSTPLSWKKLKRHFSAWLFVLKQVQQKTSEPFMSMTHQHHPSMFLDQPFSTMTTSIEWDQGLDQLVSKLPHLTRSWESIASQMNTEALFSSDHFIPESLLHGLMDLIAIVILAQDQIETIFPCATLEHCTLKHHIFKTQYPCLDETALMVAPLMTPWKEKHTFEQHNFNPVHRIVTHTTDHLTKGSEMIENLWSLASPQYLDHVVLNYTDYPESWHSVWIMAVQLCYLMSELFPASVRYYISPQQSVWMKPRQITALDSVFKTIISPCLILRDAASVCNLAKNNNETICVSVQYNKTLRQLQLHFTEQTHSVSLTILVTFPVNYPLRCAELKFFHSVGITQIKVERWLLAAKQLLLTATNKPIDHQQTVTDFTPPMQDSITRPLYQRRNCSLVACLDFFKRNAAAFLSGLEDCYICYSIVHLRTHSLPKRKCVTCKNKFHGECLDRWFKTSLKSCCPLCQSEFY